MKNESSNYNKPSLPIIRKRIGSTIYEVNAYFNPAATETVEEKILRILKNELTNVEKCGILKLSQTAGLPERSSA